MFKEPLEPDSEVVYQEPPSRTGRLAAICGALFLLGGGAGYGASTLKDGWEAPDLPPAPLHEGSVVSLGEFTVNLRGVGGSRVLRMEVQVEAEGEVGGLIDEQRSQLRDSVLTVASDYTFAEVDGFNGKMRLRDEILTRVNGVLRPHRVDRVYFTSFVIQ